METTTVRTTETGNRGAAVGALAIVGFIVLVLVGMALAVYAARFVPGALSNIGSAAVYLSSQVFPAGDEDADLVVVPPVETVPFPEAQVATSTPTTTPADPANPNPAPNPAPTRTPGQPIVIAVPVPGTEAPLYGRPDLVIESVTTGYLRTSSTGSFRASSGVPEGERGAVKFTIANRGTNVADRFQFEARLPTTPSYTYESTRQPSLRPGERIEYVLGFDQAREGNNRTITIEVDHDDDVRESNENNNRRSVDIDIED